MNSNILSSTPGGTVYNTVYPASFNQDSSAGTTNVGLLVVLPFVPVGH